MRKHYGNRQYFKEKNYKTKFSINKNNLKKYILKKL
jgi:hypothetical protein